MAASKNDRPLHLPDLLQLAHTPDGQKNNKYPYAVQRFLTYSQPVGFANTRFSDTPGTIAPCFGGNRPVESRLAGRADPLVKANA